MEELGVKEMGWECRWRGGVNVDERRGRKSRGMRGMVNDNERSRNDEIIVRYNKMRKS